MIVGFPAIAEHGAGVRGRMSLPPIRWRTRWLPIFGSDRGSDESDRRKISTGHTGQDDSEYVGAKQLNGPFRLALGESAVPEAGSITPASRIGVVPQIDKSGGAVTVRSGSDLRVDVIRYRFIIAGRSLRYLRSD